MPSIHRSRSASLGLPIALAAALLGCGAVIETAPELPPPGPLSEEESRAVGAAVNGLGADLWAQLSREPGNLAFSPASIEAALAMTAMGARNDTAAEMQAALHLGAGLGAGALIGALGDTLRRWDAPAGQAYRLRVANRLFGERSLAFDPEFLRFTRDRYAAPLSPVDFVGEHEASRGAINRWVEARTGGHIHDLLPAPAVTPETRLVLVNALSLEARWAEPFDPAQTAPAPFTLASGERARVPTMHREGYFRFGEQGGAQIVEMAYRGNELAMRFVLPPPGAPPEAWLTAERLLRPAEVEPALLDLWLPKFLIAPPASLPLSSPLRALGMGRAFRRGEADLRGIADPPVDGDRLYLSEILHQAYVRVHEEGTEAAAATASAVGGGSAEAVTPRELRFDRPFLFVLYDRPTGAALFLGRVSDPR